MTITRDMLPYLEQDVIVNRELRHLNDSLSIIVLHKEFPIWPDRTISGKTFEQIMQGDPANDKDNGWLIKDEGEWSKTEHNPTFNCHAYATHDFLELGENDWIEGEPSPLTNSTNPLASIIQSLCKPIDQQKIDPKTWNGSFSKNIVKKIKKDKNNEKSQLMIVFEKVAGGTVTYLHSGIPIKRKDQVFVKSKLGEGPLVAIPPKALAEEYAKTKINQVSIYQCKEPIN